MAVSLSSALIFSSCTNAKNEPDPNTMSGSSTTPGNNNGNQLYSFNPDIDNINQPIPAKNQW
ncbi:Uncharacterised protein, partial [Mycoplasmoides gallisepticum]